MDARLRKTALRAARIVLTVFIVLGALMFFWQERLIFHPTKLAADHKFETALPHVERIVNVDGLDIHSLHFPVKGETRKAMLFFHGNAGSLHDWSFVAQEIVDKTGWPVWIMDYPGYGKSEGSITSEEQLHRIAEIFGAMAKQELAPNGKLVVYGRSIGSGIAAKLAAGNPSVAGLILESPYFSLKDLVSKVVPWAPLFILKYTFRTDEWLPKVDAPVLIVHGTGDGTIPYEQGRRLSQLSKRVRFASVNNGGHNDLSEFPEYWKALKEYLAGPSFAGR